MLNSKKIAITGGISSGKSTFCGFLKKMGAIVVDADQIVHDLLSSSQTLLGRQVIHLLGKEVRVGRKIDRKKVATEVFNNPKKLNALEKLLHPYAFKEIEQRYQKERLKGKDFIFVVEIPLLFETKKEKEYDIIVTLVRAEETCRSLCKNIDYNARTSRLLSIEEKKKKSHFVIENNGSLKDLKRKAQSFMKSLSVLIKNPFLPKGVP